MIRRTLARLVSMPRGTESTAAARDDEAVMSRGSGSLVSPEMVTLGFVEFLLSFLAFYVLLLPAEAVATGTGMVGLHDATASHALLLACAISATSLVIGLYRPEICLQTRRLLVNTVVAGLLAFPAVLLTSAIADIDVDFLFGQDAFWPMKIFLTWIMLLFGTRLLFRVALRLGLLSRNIVVVGSPVQAARTEQAINALRKGFFHVRGIVAPADVGALTPQGLREQRVWGVVVTQDARGRVPLRNCCSRPRRRACTCTAMSSSASSNCAGWTWSRSRRTGCCSPMPWRAVRSKAPRAGSARS
jgi:hypothetical protein